MMMVKEVIIYSSIALFAVFFIHFFEGKFSPAPAECRADQICGGMRDADTGALPGESSEFQRQEQGLSHRQWRSVHSGEPE